ncbi:MAG TPA: helix-turn-helix transcriptional regulator [Solirubrobacterales bacterium]|nr:helix-turn-helix transcriptional regulator [Solirubrobacterales bacterium]
MAGDGRRRPEEVAVKFGRNLFRCRRRAAMSQEELGKLASLHRTEIGLLERGGRIPRIDTLMKLADSLAVSPMELLEGIHWTPGNSAAGAFSVSEPALPHRRRGDC